MSTFKKVLLSISLLVAFGLMAHSLKAQPKTTFTVIKVSGSIYSSTLKRAVTSGDVISPSDRLKFDSRTAYLHVVNAADGLKTIRDVPDDSPRELMGLLQTFMSNDKLAKSSRAAVEGIGKLKHQMAFDSLLILGEGKLTIGPTQLSLQSPSGIKAIYTLNGNKMEPVISDANGFSLAKNSVFKETTAVVLPKVKIIYYENLSDGFFSPIEVLGDFKPVYVNEKNLVAELKPLIETLKASGTNSEKVEAEVIEYLTVEYAPPLAPNLNDWLTKNKLTY